jgi:hypothetical protein
MKLSDPADPIPNIVHEAVGVIAAYVYAHPITVVCSPRAGGKANLIDANGRYGIAMALHEAGLLNVERTGDETPNPEGDSVMSKFKPGDRVRLTDDHSVTATVLAVHEGLYWVKYEGERRHVLTASATYFDSCYELIPVAVRAVRERRSEVRALVSLLGVMLYLAACGFVGIALWAVLG